MESENTTESIADQEVNHNEALSEDDVTSPVDVPENDDFNEDGGEDTENKDDKSVGSEEDTGQSPDEISNQQEAVNESPQVDDNNDEGIEEGEVEDSKKDDTYSSPSDSLTDNIELTTEVDLSADDTTGQSVTPPTKDPSVSSSQRSSLSPATDVSKRTSLNNKKGKRKSNDFKPTVVKPFSFTLDKRIEDRQKYNDKVHKMQKAQEERERLERERQKKEEDEQLKLERKKTIPKANPIRHYKPITITPSKKALTMPEAPNLCLENRNRTQKVADKYESPPRGGNKLKHVL